MLKIIFISIGILLLVVIGASIGVLFKREPIKGSCGGLSTLGIKKACSCKEPCDTAITRMSISTDKNLDNNVKSNYSNDRTGEGRYHP